MTGHGVEWLEPRFHPGSKSGERWKALQAKFAQAGDLGVQELNDKLTLELSKVSGVTDEQVPTARPRRGRRGKGNPAPLDTVVEEDAPKPPSPESTGNPQPDQHSEAAAAAAPDPASTAHGVARVQGAAEASSGEQAPEPSADFPAGAHSEPARGASAAPPAAASQALPQPGTTRVTRSRARTPAGPWPSPPKTRAKAPATRGKRPPRVPKELPAAPKRAPAPQAPEPQAGLPDVPESAAAQAPDGALVRRALLSMPQALALNGRDNLEPTANAMPTAALAAAVGTRSLAAIVLAQEDCQEATHKMQDDARSSPLAVPAALEAARDGARPAHTPGSRLSHSKDAAGALADQAPTAGPQEAAPAAAAPPVSMLKTPSARAAPRLGAPQTALVHHATAGAAASAVTPAAAVLAPQSAAPMTRAKARLLAAAAAPGGGLRRPPPPCEATNLAPAPEQRREEAGGALALCAAKGSGAGRAAGPAAAAVELRGSANIFQEAVGPREHPGSEERCSGVLSSLAGGKREALCGEEAASTASVDLIEAAAPEGSRGAQPGSGQDAAHEAPQGPVLGHVPRMRASLSKLGKLRVGKAARVLVAVPERRVASPTYAAAGPKPLSPAASRVLHTDAAPAGAEPLDDKQAGTPLVQSSPAAQLETIREDGRHSAQRAMPAEACISGLATPLQLPQWDEGLANMPARLPSPGRSAPTPSVADPGQAAGKGEAREVPADPVGPSSPGELPDAELHSNEALVAAERQVNTDTPAAAASSQPADNKEAHLGQELSQVIHSEPAGCAPIFPGSQPNDAPALSSSRARSDEVGLSGSQARDDDNPGSCPPAEGDPAGLDVPRPRPGSGGPEAMPASSSAAAAPRLAPAPACSKPAAAPASGGGGFGVRNLVSTMRSFVPLLGRPGPEAERAPPAAGKAIVKVRALEAADALRKREEVRAAARAAAREQIERGKAERAKRQAEAKRTLPRDRGLDAGRAIAQAEEERARRVAEEAKRREAMRRAEEEAVARKRREAERQAREEEALGRKRPPDDAPAQLHAKGLPAKRLRLPEPSAAVGSAAVPAGVPKARTPPAVARLPLMPCANRPFAGPAPAAAAATCSPVAKGSSAAREPVAAKAGPGRTHTAMPAPLPSHRSQGAAPGNAGKANGPPPREPGPLEAAQPAAQAALAATGPGVGAAQPLESYEISPYRGSSSEETEDEEEATERGGRRKRVPDWARGRILVGQLVAQTGIDPDEVFQQRHKTCSLDEVFGHSECNGSRKDLNRRTSSGNWIGDRVTWQEELNYKKAMGYV